MAVWRAGGATNANAWELHLRCGLLVMIVHLRAVGWLVALVRNRFFVLTLIILVHLALFFSPRQLGQRVAVHIGCLGHAFAKALSDAMPGFYRVS